jgi:hypothetical protein
MQLVTLDSIRSISRLYADERPGGTAQFVPDANLDTLINLKCAEHYDICVKARPEFYMVEQCITTAEPIACICGRRMFVQMPTCPPFYEMGGIEIKWSDSDIEPIDEIRAANSFRYEAVTTVDRWTAKGYVFGGSPIDGGEGFYIAPTLALGTTIRLRYVPPFPKLGETDCCGNVRDKFNAVNGWDKLVGLGVALELLAIRGKGPGLVGGLYTEQLERVKTMAGERNAQESRQVRDVFPEARSMLRWQDRLPQP